MDFIFFSCSVSSRFSKSLLKPEYRTSSTGTHEGYSGCRSFLLSFFKYSILY